VRALKFDLAKYPFAYPLIAAALLTATGLGVGFVADDAYHLLVMRGDRVPAIDGNLYSFMPGDAAIAQPFIETGPFPWWMYPEAKARFFRPLTNTLHHFDYHVFGMHALWWHLHGLLWYLAMVLAWILIARRSLSPPIATFASLLFAIDYTHWMPAVWIANRNALIACVPALFGVYAHIRWRETGWKPGLPLSVLGYAIGMFGGEAWLGMSAYVAAYELFGRRDSFVSRMTHLLPAATCAIVYAAAYMLSDYGVYGSGAYLQPLSAEYVKEAPGRILGLIGAHVFGAPIDAWAFFPSSRIAFAAIGIIALILLSILLHHAWPVLEERHRTALRWLIPGAVMSILPVIAAFPMSRLLLGPSIAGSAVIAVVLTHWWQTRVKGRIRATGIVCAYIAFIHIVVAVIAWPVLSGFVTFAGRWAERVYTNSPIDDTRVAEQNLYLIAANDPMTIMYPPIIRRLAGSPVPRSWHCLSGSMGEHIFTRTAANAFELESKKGALVQGVFAEILRDISANPFSAGDKVKLLDATIEVLDVVDGRPRKIRVTCDKPLDDPSIVFLQWKDRSLQLFVLPPVGESREVKYFSE
jgi:hypothetical protein